MPTRTAKDPLQFLNDLTVAPHRPVEALQVAVDHEVEVAQTLTTGQRNSTERLGLVTLTVPEETPDFAVAMINEATLGLILHDVGLIDRLNRPEAHRHGGKLPVIRHQPGMGVRR